MPAGGEINAHGPTGKKRASCARENGAHDAMSERHSSVSLQDEGEVYMNNAAAKAKKAGRG
jgi:hypothetical protein